MGCIIDADSTYERKGFWAFGKLKKWLNDSAGGIQEEKEAAVGSTPGYRPGSSKDEQY